MRFSALARWYGRAPRRSHTGRGQALVEFALMALLFFTLLFGVIEIGRLLHSWVTLEHASSEAGRYATHGEGHTTGQREAQVRQTARMGATGLVIDDAAGPNDPGYFGVTIRSSGSSGDPGEDDDAGGPNEFVRVSLLYNHPVLTFALGRTYIPLQSEVLVLNERYARPSGIAGGLPGGGGLAGGQLPATPMATWTPRPTPSITPTPSATPPVPCYTLSTSVSPGGWGTVSVSLEPNCSGGGYASGTRVTLTAHPECRSSWPWGGCRAYYRFERWSGDASGTSSSVSVTMNGNRSITARFRE